jgi:hypothetical protein
MPARSRSTMAGSSRSSSSAIRSLARNALISVAPGYTQSAFAMCTVP